jgi:hypothetical protein
MTTVLFRTADLSASLRRFVCICMLVASTTAYAQSSANPEPLGLRVAISTFIYLADIDTRDFLEDRRAYLPAGTRFIIFDEKERFRGVDWRLILTETGLWGYIKSTESPDQYFDPSNRQLFIDNERIAIIQRSGDIDIVMSPTAKIVVTLTRSENYRMLGETEEGISISLDKIKLGQDVRIEAVIPYEKNMVTIFDSKNNLTRDNIHEFERSIADGVFGIQKPCGVEQIGRLGSGGGGEFSFDAWFVKAHISGSAQITREEVLDPKFGIRRTYFHRRGIAGSYHMTEKQECTTPEQALSYRVVNPESREIEINEDFAQAQGFNVDNNTRRLLITTPEDYFKLFDILKGRQFKEDEIPFLISELAVVIPSS